MFTGPTIEPAVVEFGPDLMLLYGASNTGKSFAVKSLDFLLGGSKPLPEIGERTPYDQIWLALSVPKQGEITLTRAIVGGSLELIEGLATSRLETKQNEFRTLSARNDAEKPDNVSYFLLDCLGLLGKQVAIDSNGKKRPLSFRDISRFCITDETTIQSEQSPAQSGQHSDAPRERSVFKLLLSGMDDSAIVEVVDRRTFKTSTAAKKELVEELLAAVNSELESDFPNSNGLAAQNERLNEAFVAAQANVDAAQTSIRALLSEKRALANDIYEREERLGEIGVSLGRFAELEGIYRSDIERLESLEEAGFLLALGGDRDCPLCGASPDAQRHVHGLEDVNRARAAVDSEITKIKQHRNDLSQTIHQLMAEEGAIKEMLPRTNQRFDTVEAELAHRAPVADEAQGKLNELISVRDHIQHGLSLLDQKLSFEDRLVKLSSLKPASKAEKPKLGVSGPIGHEFAQVVSRVLSEWHFPGNRHVTFDEESYDLRIDGKLRRDNGKGVRAITHAAFKIALLIYCHERNLPHPGFVLLDTPLLTYRDPINSRGGDLTADERALSKTALKEHFFRHLAGLKDIGQIIVVENVDPPTGIEKLAAVQIFSGEAGKTRFGLFPPSASQTLLGSGNDKEPT